MTVEAFLWFAAVALLFGSGPLREGYRRIARAIDAVTGVLFAGFGIGLVVSVLRNEAYGIGLFAKKRPSPIEWYHHDERIPHFRPSI